MTCYLMSGFFHEPGREIPPKMRGVRCLGILQQRRPCKKVAPWSLHTLRNCHQLVLLLR
jgi:hypothetical protein